MGAADRRGWLQLAGLATGSSAASYGMNAALPLSFLLRPLSRSLASSSTDAVVAPEATHTESERALRAYEPS